MERFTKKEMGQNSWKAKGQGFSGLISVEIGSDDPVWVVPSYFAWLSKAGFGGAGKGEWWHLKDDDDTISMATIYACALMVGKWAIDKRSWDDFVPRKILELELLRAANNHPNKDPRSKGSYALWPELVKEARGYLTAGVYEHGSQSLEEAANLLKLVEPDNPESKYRELDLHEMDTVEAIKIATLESWDLPTQDAVWKLWKKRDPDLRKNQRKKFDGNLKRLGFDWLPPKTPERGKNAHFK